MPHTQEACPSCPCPSFPMPWPPCRVWPLTSVVVPVVGVRGGDTGTACFPVLGGSGLEEVSLGKGSSHWECLHLGPSGCSRKAVQRPPDATCCWQWERPREGAQVQVGGRVSAGWEGLWQLKWVPQPQGTQLLLITTHPVVPTVLGQAVPPASQLCWACGQCRGPQLLGATPLLPGTGPAPQSLEHPGEGSGCSPGHPQEAHGGLGSRPWPCAAGSNAMAARRCPRPSGLAAWPFLPAARGHGSRPIKGCLLQHLPL